MKNRFLNLLAIIKNDFHVDAFGTLMLYGTYFVVAASIISIPLFTYRDNLTFITNILCTAASIAIVIYIFFRGRFYFNFYILFTALFLLYTIIITLIANRQFGFNRLQSLFTLYGYIFCLIEFWFNKKSEKFFTFIFCFGALIFTVLFVYTYRENIIAMNFDERFGNDFGNVNTICFVFVLCIMFLLYATLKIKKWAFLLLIPIVIMAFCAIITGSRWGFVCLVIGIALLLYQMIGKFYKFEFAASVILLIVLFIGVLQIPVFAHYKKHFIAMFDFFTGKGRESGSSAVRTAMFLDGIKLWFKNVFFGYGSDGFMANTSYGMYSHSTIIELLTNFGLFGFTLFFLPILKLLSNTKKRKNYSFFSLSRSLILVFIVYSFFAMFHSSKVGILCLSIIVGIDFYCNKETEIYFELSFFNKNKFSFKHKLSIPDKTVKQEYELPSNYKIAFVISALYGGGAEKVATILANSWIERGHQVTFFITSKTTNKKYPLNEKINVVRPISNSKLRFLPSFKINRLSNEIEKYQPDIIVSFLTTPCYYASCVSKRLGIPLICSERNDPSKSNILYKCLKKISYRRADSVVFQGQYPMEYFSKGIQKKSMIINNPVVTSQVTRSSKNNVIISAGRLEPLKGFDTLIKSFAIVSNVAKDYSLRIYGNGSEHDKLEKMINDFNLSNKISLLPFTDKIHQEMKNSQIYVMSSRHEGMPNALCEALMLGLPCVATDCPIGLSQTLINHKENGIVCKTNDHQDMANAIIEIIRDLKEYSQNAENKVNQYTDLFNPNRISSEWIDLITKTLVDQRKE